MWTHPVVKRPRTPSNCLLLGALVSLWAGCEEETLDPRAEVRVPCAQHNPQRSAYFGDLHLHTGFSFDAYVYGNHFAPEDAYRFARGEAIVIPTANATDEEIAVRLDRPLDFAMVSDHAEFLGEVLLCTREGSPGYDSPTCNAFRRGGDDGVTYFGMQTALQDPDRLDLCGAANPGCMEAALKERWQAIWQAAEEAYDRTAACEFVSFVGYEYTATPDVVNMHRNVIFRGSEVLDAPISYYEAPDPYSLWRGLAALCLDADAGCDVLTIGHNSNLSNGNYFWPGYGGARTEAEEREAAALRARMEPLVEIFQHKGDMECRLGLQGPGSEPDPLCDFEKQRPPDAEDCGESVGSGGMRLGGCVSRRDFLRNTLKDGLAEEARLGLNPYRFGIVAGTDTHNGTAGYTLEHAFHGHVGDVDNQAIKRLAPGNLTHDTIINNPGGLMGVWAEERSRDSIFLAMRRREVFGTSGPRIRIRLFGGWRYSDGLCAHEGWEKDAYASGVPMGQELPRPPGQATSPTFVVWAAADEGTLEHPGVGLQRLQIIKGWLDAVGETHERVFDVAGDEGNGASVDLATCAPLGSGEETLCAVWSDPDFDPSERAFYYARAVQNPTCRWSTWDCLRMDSALRPATCDEPPSQVKPVIHERAWSSPIWYTP